MGTTSLSRAVRFYWEAKTINSIHSPLFYKLCRHLFDLNKHYYDDYKIEQQRIKLLLDKRKLTYADLGAGSLAAKNSSILERSVSELAKNSTSNKYKCKVLRNLVSFFQPNTIIEFGTNLGIATSYMHAASKGSKLITLEGVKEIRAIAEDVFKVLGFESIDVVCQNFDDFISESEDLIENADLVFLDGDHQYSSTIHNFRRIWGDGNRAKVVIIDDINWSEGMAEAWEEIKQIPNTNTLDLYKLGIVIRDENLKEPLHIKYIPRLLKPLSFGFFG